MNNKLRIDPFIGDEFPPEAADWVEAQVDKGQISYFDAWTDAVERFAHLGLSRPVGVGIGRVACPV